MDNKFLIHSSGQAFEPVNDAVQEGMKNGTPVLLEGSTVHRKGRNHNSGWRHRLDVSLS